MKRVTIKDVAQRANVSIATVSRALSGSTEIGEQTRVRIEDLCKEMGYSAGGGCKSKFIGMIVSSITSSFTAESAYYVQEQVEASGYDLVLCNSSYNLDKEAQAYRRLMEQQVAGIIVKQSYGESYRCLAPYLGQTPTVFLGEEMPGAQQSYVVIDNQMGAYMGTEYLYSLGHRDILFFGRRSNKESRIQRAKGYARACGDLGLRPLFVDYDANPVSDHQSVELAKRTLSRADRPTAVFAATDAMALGVMQAADELGISIPGELSLLGFDNVASSSLPRIGLTTIEQPKQTLAAAAVQMLLEHIRYPSMPPTSQVLPPALVIRNTCRPIDLAEAP